jgi:transmembrane sensor
VKRVRETGEAINRQATEWLARIDRQGLDAQLKAELDQWLDGDTRRRGAFLRARASWQALDRAGAMEPAAAKPQPSRRGLLWGGGAIAASLAGLLTVRVLGEKAERTEITTALGEIRRTPLSDGSMAAVNTETVLAVEMRPRQRDITLDRGEAWFLVAKDKTRPFVVAAGEVRVRAVGTAFSVRRRGGGADVQVTEGVVETWVVGREKQAIRLSAGSRAFIGDAGVEKAAVEAPVEIDRSLAWRSGQIILDGDTLGDAAAEFNRYNARKVVITDPAVARQTLVGRFRTNEPENFARAVAAMVGAPVRVTNDEIRVGAG